MSQKSTSQKRERSGNFNRDEIDLLVNLVEQKKNIIENKKSDSQTWTEKESCWNEIEKSFNSSSGHTHRSAKTLKLKYEGIKRETRKKSASIRAETYRTGGGPSTAPVLTPTEEKVKQMILLTVDGMESTFDSDQVQTDNTSQSIMLLPDDGHIPLINENHDVIIQLDNAHAIPAEVQDTKNGEVDVDYAIPAIPADLENTKNRGDSLGAFDDEDVIHVDGEVNPVRDLETIGEELRLKDEEQLMQHIEKLDRQVNRGNDKKLKPEYDTLQKVKTVIVDEKKHIRFSDWSAADIEVLNKYLFITSKPALYLVNLSEKDYIRKKNKWLPKLKEWIDKNDPGAPLIPFSGVLEYKLFDMEPAEKEAFLKEHNITSALDKIIIQGYKALQLEYFFTAGEDEVKAWTIQKGTKAPQAAGRIHTDFEKGFIMAEVMHYKDFKEEGSEAACKSAGKYRQQGRNYVVEDGDIIFFKFNAGAGLKDPKKK